MTLYADRLAALVRAMLDPTGVGLTPGQEKFVAVLEANAPSRKQERPAATQGQNIEPEDGR